MNHESASCLILDSRTWSYTATIQKSMKAHTDITLELITVQSNAVKPVPATIRQKDPQSLKYDTDLFVVSPYATAIQRTKIRYVQHPFKERTYF
jgi:dolichyl-diphosphooligosaccharide---protein glycosyltransferase subunit 1 (ribophorin I)